MKTTEELIKIADEILEVLRPRIDTPADMICVLALMTDKEQAKHYYYAFHNLDKMAEEMKKMSEGK